MTAVLHLVPHLVPRVASGAIKYREDIVEGFKNAPAAFMSMLTGGNFGKLIVKVS